MQTNDYYYQIELLMLGILETMVYKLFLLDRNDWKQILDIWIYDLKNNEILK